MIIRGRVATIPNDSPVPNGTTGEIRLLSDNSLVDTVTTTDGWYEYVQNGSPGPLRVFWNYSSVIKNQYSKLVGPSGPVDVSGIPIMFRIFNDGVISGLGGEMAVTSSGANMQVAVAAGGATVRGILYDQLVADSYTVEAANTAPRIDTIVVEVVPPGAGEDIEGRAEIKIIKGTPHATTPVQPTLTQTTVLYQYPLANIAVGANVTVIGSDKITDRRTWARTVIPPDSITPTELNDDALAVFALKESGATVNSVPVNRLNFNGDHFNLAINPSFSGKQIDISLANAGGVSRPVFMPVTEFVATGPISSGTRTVATMGVGPLPATVPYAVWLYAGITCRNQINTGTVIARCNVDGGTQRTHEFQVVGGVPRWMPVIQTAQVTKSTTTAINVTMSIQYNSGDPTDVRAGQLSVIAFPASLLAGA